MDARSIWKQFAMSDEGRALAADLEAVEDDQLHKQAEIDRKITAAYERLAARMDKKDLVDEGECEGETFYRSRVFHDHVELTVKIPIGVVVELADMWTHYEDHNCGEAASILDSWTHSLIMMMADSLPAELVADILEGEEEEDE